MSDLATSAKLHLWYVQDLGDLGDLCKVAFVVCTGRHMQPKEGIRQQWSLGLLGVAFDRKTKAAFVQVFENQNTFHNVLIAIPGCETTPVCDKTGYCMQCKEGIGRQQWWVSSRPLRSCICTLVTLDNPSLLPTMPAYEITPVRHKTQDAVCIATKDWRT